MTTPPSYRKVNPADAPILLLALQSDTMPLPKLDDFAEDVISPALSTIDGVGEVQVFGARNTPCASSSTRPRWPRAASASTR